MSSVNRGRATEISSLRDLEKEFSTIAKLFVGKETESNWNDRDKSIRQIHAVLLNSEYVASWKEGILKGLHDNMAGLIKSIHSLRTAVAIEGLSFVEDMGTAVGDALDIYTLETILTNLLKSSSVTKKMVSNKTLEVTNSFLTCTSFHTKLLSMLCKTVSEKNIQLRQYASQYIQTVLETHGSKEFVKLAVEKPELNQRLEHFLKKGLVDAAPSVREACRQTYVVYRMYWPERAEKLCRSMDTSTQRLLEKSTPKASPQRLVPRLISKRSNSASSLSSRTSTSSSTSTATSPTTTASSITTTATTTSTTTSNGFKRPILKRSLSAHAIPVRKPKAPIPATSAEVKKNINTHMNRLSHISNVSAPSTNIAHKIKVIDDTASASRRTQSEFHQQSVLASASLLYMLQSSDCRMKCKGIHLLSERLRNTAYRPSPASTILPPDVPSKIDILPILMDALSRTDMEMEMYETLMSWECLAGIFVYVMSFNYYCPTLVIADQQCKYSNRSIKETNIMSVYSKGLTRLKMFLKRNDPDLAQRLLDIVNSINTTPNIDDMDLLDASVKRDLQLFPTYKVSLQCGLLQWMDEILCDYIGLPEDEDAEMLMEGSRWLNVSAQELSASQWFDDNVNTQSYVSFVTRVLLQEPPKEIYTVLCQMLSHLKIANERVFETETKELDAHDLSCIEKALSMQHKGSGNSDLLFDDIQVSDEEEQLTDQDFDLDYLYAGKEGLVDGWKPFGDIERLQEVAEEEGSGVTQDISNINIDSQLERNIEKENEMLLPVSVAKQLSEENPFLPAEYADPDRPVHLQSSPRPYLKKRLARPAPESPSEKFANEDKHDEKKRRQNPTLY